MEKTVWYLWAVDNDPTTNEYLAKVIGEQNPEYLCSDKSCADGKDRNLFWCPQGYENVKSAIAAIEPFGLKIEVFREEVEDVVVRYDLWKKQVQKKARTVRRSALMARPHKKST